MEWQQREGWQQWKGGKICSVSESLSKVTAPCLRKTIGLRSVVWPSCQGQFEKMDSFVALCLQAKGHPACLIQMMTRSNRGKWMACQKSFLSIFSHRRRILLCRWNDAVMSWHVFARPKILALSLSHCTQVHKHHQSYCASRTLKIREQQLGSLPSVGFQQVLAKQKAREVELDEARWRAFHLQCITDHRIYMYVLPLASCSRPGSGPLAGYDRATVA
jgi:hypothetical protein